MAYGSDFVMPTAEEILAALDKAKTEASGDKTPEAQPPAPTETPKVAEVSVVEFDELAELHKQASAIMSQYGMLSNVPLDSAYWGIMNRIRTLRAQSNA